MSGVYGLEAQLCLPHSDMGSSLGAGLGTLSLHLGTLDPS